MKVLIAKDWRNNRAIVIGGLVMMAIPYLITFSSTTVDRLSHPSSAQWSYVDAFWHAANVDLSLIVPLLSAVFGGAAFAQERREGSADFLAMMPVSRATIVKSKLIVSAGWLTALAVVSALVMFVAWLVEVRRASLFHSSDLMMPLSCAVMAFGVAWGLSAFLSSPSMAASISLGFTIASSIMLGVVFNSLRPTGRDGETLMIVMVSGWTLVWGISAFVAGTIHYLKRVAP